MKQTFKEYYQKQKELFKAYDEARAEADEAVRAAKEADVVNEHGEFMAAIEEQGRIVVMLYDLYAKAQDVGNPYIDFAEPLKDEDIPEIVQTLDQYGEKAFTYSSSWSSAVETAWLFQANGCRVAGVVEIKSQHKVFMEDEYEKVHAYKFKID